MGVFDDKKFEELDWISQATEPIDSKLNEVLGLLPDLIEIDFSTYKDILRGNYSLELEISSALNYAINKLTNIPYSNLSYHQLDALKKCFQFELEGDEVILDFENSIIRGGNLRFVKITSTMDEDTLKGMLGFEGVQSFSYASFNDFSSLSRANEIMEILGKCEEGLRTRSSRRKRHVITRRLQSLFKTNEWNIKDTELANKVGHWIADYITDGNLAAFSNFCRLKVMTHKGQPIYSMEEIV